MIFDAAEKYQSQVPAIQVLVALGYSPLSQADACYCAADACECRAR